MRNHVLRSVLRTFATAAALAVLLHGADRAAAPSLDEVIPSCVPAPWCRV